MIDPGGFKRTVLAMGATVLLLSGCDQLGNPIDAITGNVAAPNEFDVIARKPLRMPQSIRVQDLPEPRLGARSPLDPDPNADAARALLGAGATGGTTVVSTSENALVGAARAATTRDAQVVTQDDLDRASAGSEELPTVLELAGLAEETSVDVLDADAEARRLQNEGANAPVNPNPESEEERSSSAIFRW